MSELNGKPQSWLAQKSGLSEKTVSDYIRNGIPSTGAAIKIAQAFNRSLDWLLTGANVGGAGGSTLTDAADADFVGLPRFDLRHVTEAGRGNRIDTIPFRRDWLNRRVGTASGLWVAELPSSYEELGLAEGDAVICSDIARGETPPDNTICIFLGDGMFVARYRSRWVFESGDLAGPRVGPADLADGVQPIARIRARMLANI